ncbi:MAG: hypothetical protein IH784_06095 [Bacteroidetes bacterium]|nr:hypothetical protein [Bacteroidota bacterium]
MKLIHIIFLFIVVLTLNINGETLSEGKLREVSISILILDIIKIDDTNQRSTIDFVVQLEWMEKNLVSKWKEKTLVSKDESWTPDNQIFNDYNLIKKKKDQYEVNPDVSVFYQQRFVGGINSRHNFSEFPLDEFIMKIQIVAINPDVIFIVSNNSPEDRSHRYSISGWKINSEWIEVGVGDERFKDLANTTYFITAKRKINYYIWKVIIPLAMVVFMSWLVFWVDPIQIGAQLTVGATAMLTMIAYQFTLSNLIPPVSYLTRLDTFILLSNIIVFIALLEAILTSNLVSHDKKTIARRMDYLARFIFPIAYTIVFIKSFWI